MSRFKAALIGEYVEGLECTVLVAENPCDPARPTTYTPIQYHFPAGESFKHEALKWIHWNDLKALPVEDPALAARLRDEATKFFIARSGLRVNLPHHRGHPRFGECLPEINVWDRNRRIRRR